MESPRNNPASTELRPVKEFSENIFMKKRSARSKENTDTTSVRTVTLQRAIMGSNPESPAAMASDLLFFVKNSPIFQISKGMREERIICKIIRGIRESETLREPARSSG